MYGARCKYDTAAIQRAPDSAVGRLLFIDAGTYIVTSHVTIPAGSRIVGECWSQVVAYVRVLWTSTITKRPMTITEWRFKPVVVGNNSPLQERVPYGDFFPVPASTTTWPAVVYTSPNGALSTISPTVAAPTLVASVGPNAPPPPQGSWPTIPSLIRIVMLLRIENSLVQH